MEERLGEIEEEEERLVSEGRTLGGSMVVRRRVAVTWAVGEAWEVFSRERSVVVRKAFRMVGLSLPVDGSEDSQLCIKGLASDFLIQGLKEWNSAEEEGNADVDLNVDSDEETSFTYE